MFGVSIIRVKKRSGTGAMASKWVGTRPFKCPPLCFPSCDCAICIGRFKWYGDNPADASAAIFGVSVYCRSGT
jgi:hypothetical protein